MISRSAIIGFAVLFLAALPITSATLVGIPFFNDKAAYAAPLSVPWSFLGQNQQNTFYSPQTVINASSVVNLKLDWSTTLPNIAGTPVISNGIVYATGGSWGPLDNQLAGSIYALDENTGNVIWTDGPSAQTGLTFSDITGVAIDNGNIFAATDDNYLVSLNAATGALNWKASVTQGLAENPGAVLGGAEATPLVWHGEVIVSNTGTTAPSRGYLRAFSESNGALLWTFYTVPESPMTSSNQAFYKNSWGSCTNCGGGDVWNIPAIDPQTGIVYFGTGNAYPYFNASQREPNPTYTNLYTDCVIALNATSGQMIWYYQETTRDVHDWDTGMPVQVFTTAINGVQKEVVGSGSKSGNFYLLDAQTGGLIYSVSLGIHRNTNQDPTPQGEITYPGSNGGVNTYYSYDSMTNMVYIVAYNSPNEFHSAPIDSTIPAGSDRTVSVPDNSTLYAVNASTGSVVWTMNMQGLSGGVSSTNNLVFTGDAQGGFYALNAQTGAILWVYASGKSGYLANFGPPSVADGMLFEGSYVTNGGVMAFNLSSTTTATCTTASTTSTSSTISVTSSTTTESTTNGATTSSSTTTTLGSSSSTTKTTSSTTGGGGVIPEFPYQLFAATVFTFVLAASYLLARRRKSSSPG